MEQVLNERSDCTTAEFILYKRDGTDVVQGQITLKEEEMAISFRPGSGDGHQMYPSHLMN